MNKKGFTLIELLAVIVILAIIAIIATPIILNVIDTARKGAKESSALGYVDAVEKQVMLAEVDTAATKIETGTYTVAQLTGLGVKVKGEAPEDTSVITIGNKGEVTNAWITYKDSEYKVYYDGKEAVADTEDYKDSKGVTHNDIGTPTQTFGGTKVNAQTGETHKGIVYLDPTNLSTTCNQENSVSTTETTTGCMKWYIYGETETQYKLILDHNTGAGFYWNDSSLPVTYESSAAYTVIQNLNWLPSLNTTIITTDEINAITGKTEFDSTDMNSWYYLDGKNQTAYSPKTAGESAYAWLFDYTNNCTRAGCNVASVDYISGYYTRDIVGTTGSIWIVIPGMLDWDSENYGSSIGVRPVITVSKSIFN